MGSVAILNVGAGDIRLTFDKDNVSESIRAARIVKDMLRRGYALLVEVERDGEKKFERALDFNEQNQTYIIADFAPETSALELQTEPIPEDDPNGESITTEMATLDAGAGTNEGKRRGRPRKEVPAGSTRAVAVARSAGG